MLAASESGAVIVPSLLDWFDIEPSFVQRWGTSVPGQPAAIELDGAS